MGIKVRRRNGRSVHRAGGGRRAAAVLLAAGLAATGLAVAVPSRADSASNLGTNWSFSSNVRFDGKYDFVQKIKSSDLTNVKIGVDTGACCFPDAGTTDRVFLYTNDGTLYDAFSVPKDTPADQFMTYNPNASGQGFISTQLTTAQQLELEQLLNPTLGDTKLPLNADGYTRLDPSQFDLSSLSVTNVGVGGADSKGGKGGADDAGVGVVLTGGGTWTVVSDKKVIRSTESVSIPGPAGGTAPGNEPVREFVVRATAVISAPSGLFPGGDYGRVTVRQTLYVARDPQSGQWVLTNGIYNSTQGFWEAPLPPQVDTEALHPIILLKNGAGGNGYTGASPATPNRATSTFEYSIQTEAGINIGWPGSQGAFTGGVTLQNKPVKFSVDDFPRP